MPTKVWGGSPASLFRAPWAEKTAGAATLALLAVSALPQNSAKKGGCVSHTVPVSCAVNQQEIEALEKIG